MDFDSRRRRAGKIASRTPEGGVQVVDSVCNLKFFDAFVVNAAAVYPQVIFGAEAQPADLVGPARRGVLEIENEVNQAFVVPLAAAHVTLKPACVKEFKVAAQVWAFKFTY